MAFKNDIISGLLLVFSISGPGLLAQPKKLTLEQVKANDYGSALKEMPRFVKWIDDRYFILNSSSSPRVAGRTMVMDATTGEEITDTSLVKWKPEPTRAQVRVKDGDLYFENRRLTTTVEAEQNPDLSPNGSEVAFLRGNNLFVLQLSTGKEQQLTFDGSKVVYNGRSSWVYNEEILGRGMNYRAFWWSPDSKRIAFMRFDDSKVPVTTLVHHTKNFRDSLQEWHYPLAGDPNPTVKMGIAQVGGENPVVRWADFNETDDQYFGTPIWTPDGKLLVQWMNRRQDSLIVYAVNPATGSKKSFYTEVQSTWVDLDKSDRFTFAPDGKTCILKSDRSGWEHLYLLDGEGRQLQPITSGEWQVNAIEYISPEGWIFFSAKKDDNIRLDLYKVYKDGKGLQRLSFGPYSHRVSISARGSYFVTSYSNSSTPAQLALVHADGKQVKLLGNSRGDDFESYDLGRTEIFRVPSSDGLFQLPLRINWPAGLDTNKRYPLAIHIYGGPGRHNVNDIFRSPISQRDWIQQEELITLTMDHRGSGLFGKKGMNHLHHQLGRWEIEDYSTVVKWLLKKYPFIDPQRVMISGFSYGGYLTCLALTKAPDVFTHGIAGGSVTDWRLYDSHYTERYMGHPNTNAAGYKQASVITYASQYKGLLRLEHGTVDDNVHPHNTLLLVNTLQQAAKHFELMMFPGSAHGWSFNSAKSRYVRMEDVKFLYEHLLKKAPPAALTN